VRYDTIEEFNVDSSVSWISHVTMTSRAPVVSAQSDSETKQWNFLWKIRQLCDDWWWSCMKWTLWVTWASTRALTSSATGSR